MAVDGVDGSIIADTDVVGLDTNNRTQLLVKLVHPLVSVTSPDYRQQPEVCELGWEGRGNLAQSAICNEVGNKVVKDSAHQQDDRRPWGHEKADDGHLLNLNDEAAWVQDESG